MKGAVLLLIGCLAAVNAEPVKKCEPGIMFIADLEDLCSYWWCVDGEEPIKWRCPPGARVPTWFDTAPEDYEIPCIIDHSTSTTCLRCDFGPDERFLPRVDSCEGNPCPSNCECQNLWGDEFHCICPGDVVPAVATVERPDIDFCASNPCQNGAECFNQWDTYWCQCPNGYTGKNCEVPFCVPNPCMNGGTCTIDDHNYHCECTSCFTGACCNVTLPGCSRSTTTQRVTTALACSACDVNVNGRCEPNVASCDCNPCPSGETCIPGRGRQPRQCNRESECGECETLISTFTGPASCRRDPRLCECSPCEQGQLCFDGVDDRDRQCFGRPSSAGSQYTLTFSDDTLTGPSYRRVYVTIAGADITGSRTVRFYTPGISEGQNCHVDFTVTVTLEQPFYYDVEPNCLNTQTGDIESNKILRVVEQNGGEMTVTVSNVDGDGYLAIPDAHAGTYYVPHGHESSGFEQYVTIVALFDNTRINFHQQVQESFDFGFGADSQPQGFDVYNLNALESFRIPANLKNTALAGSREFLVWSGNDDTTSQKTQEMLVPVNRWGSGRSFQYIIMSAATNNLNLDEEIDVEAAVTTSYSLVKGDNDVTNGTFMEQTSSHLGQIRAGEVWTLFTNRPVQVTQHIRGANSENVNFHSAYALIPNVQNYAQSYSFTVHGSRDGVGSDYSRNIVTLYITGRGLLADAPDYYQDVFVYRYNWVNGQQTIYSLEELGGRYIKAAGQQFDYGVRVELPGPGVYYFNNPYIQMEFGAVYFGYTVNGQRSIQPNTGFPLGYDRTNTNNIPSPVECSRCFFGPDCSQRVISSCVCNPCENFDDTCIDNPSPNEARICQSVPDSTGNPFTLVFMQNRPDNTEKRELEVYVTSAGSSSREVTVHTPFLPPNHPCYLNIQRTVAGFEVSQFLLPNPDCYETIGEGVFSDKAIRVEAAGGEDLSVYAVNREAFSADGFVCLPDKLAGQNFYVVTHSPPPYESEFAVLALNDSTRVEITYPAGVVPANPATIYNLRAGEVLQIQNTGDLTGTRIQTSKPCNVYSGNVRALVVEVEDPEVGNINSESRDHIVEQMLPVRNWGTQFNVVPIPDRSFGDQLRVVAAFDNTEVTVDRLLGDILTTKTFTINAGQFFTTDVVSGSQYRVTSNGKKILVTQLVKSAERGFFHDPSLITVPPVEQYSNRYIFNTPEFSGGEAGAKRPYNTTLVLISARDADKDGIFIYSRLNQQSSSSSVTDLAQLQGSEWGPVPGTDYVSVAVRIPFGTSLIVHRDPSVQFMLIFYGFDDRESLGFPIGLRLQDVPN